MSVNKKCDLYDDGKCNGYNGWRGKKRKCETSTAEWFDKPSEFNAININEMCRRRSIFGNDYFVITNKQIEQLKKGKVLFYIDEYGMFILLEDFADMRGEE